MARLAVALGRILVAPQPAQFGGRQRGLAGEHAVVLAVERAELPALLVDLERQRGPLDGLLRVGEHVVPRRAERAAELRRVARGRQLAREAGIVAVGHLIGGEQRQARLLARAVDAPVPGQATGRTGVHAMAVLVVDEVLGEARHELRVAQRRDGARAHVRRIVVDERTGRARWGRRRRPGRGTSRRRDGRCPTGLHRRRSRGRGRPAAAPWAGCRTRAARARRASRRRRPHPRAHSRTRPRRAPSPRARPSRRHGRTRAGADGTRPAGASRAQRAACRSARKSSASVRSPIGCRPCATRPSSRIFRPSSLVSE